MKRWTLLLPLMAAACTTTPAPHVDAPAPPPVVVPPKPAVTPDWRDKPYTPGTWRYADRAATYAADGSAPLLVMRCDPQARTISLSVGGTVPSLAIRTSYGERTWPAQAGLDGRSVVTLAATDAALDQIAFSRGRFSISGPGFPEIDIPAWAEPSRVIEDCRG